MHGDHLAEPGSRVHLLRLELGDIPRCPARTPLALVALALHLPPHPPHPTLPCPPHPPRPALPCPPHPPQPPTCIAASNASISSSGRKVSMRRNLMTSAEQAGQAGQAAPGQRPRAPGFPSASAKPQHRSRAPCTCHSPVWGARPRARLAAPSCIGCCPAGSRQPAPASAVLKRNW